jgi:beta-glucosidase
MTSESDDNIHWEKLRDLSADQIEEKIKEIIPKMTIEQKLNQMKADWSLIPMGLKMIRYNSVPIPAGEDKKLGIPPILFTDGPRGIVIGNSTCFPVSMARGATWDVELEETVGNVIGIEARSYGANFYAGVCINLLRHPAWGRAQETYGEDPCLLGEMGCALIRGTQKHVIACAKHYACNSMENMRFKVNVKIDERSLREVYLYHFKKCVDTGVAAIMSAYNKVNGYYCGHNTHLLRDILKKDWNFKGFVISDFLFGIRSGIAAVNGGLDIEMPFKIFMRPYWILKAIKKGKVSESLIDDAVIRILRQKLRFNKTLTMTPYSLDKIACEEHTQLALEVARKSIVLLKNDSKILPLNQNNVKKIALIGKLAISPNIGDHGSSRVHSKYVITPYMGLKKLLGTNTEIVYESGKNLQKAIAAAQSADVVIFIGGYTFKDEGEYITRFTGGDRRILTLKPRDEKLIQIISKINPNFVVVMESGSSILTEKWRDKVPAILMAWYPGMEGGTALAEIIFGKINPSGKLPVTFPKSESQLPFFNSKAKEITYDYFHGHWLLEKNNQEPAFPFGFGLSYTTYRYENLRIDKKDYKGTELLTASIDVTNTGDIAGEEIIQAYIGHPKTQIEYPAKQLKGFAKLSLKPKEKKSVIIKITLKDLAYYDVTSKEWIVEKGTYTILIGPSSTNTELISTTFAIN